MKQFFISLILIVFVSFLATSQSLSLKTSTGMKINNGDTITLTDTDADADFSINFWITNISSSTIEIKAKKTELGLVAGSDNYFCSWTSCYLSSTYVTPDSLPLAAGVVNKAFIVDYGSNGNSGKSTVMYTIFDMSNTSDSIAVVVNYIAGFVGIESTTDNVTISNAYPNPTKDRFFLDYNFADSRNAKVEIMNVVGNIVSEQYINPQSSHASINVENLSSGIYFYNVIVDGNKIASKKLIIQR